MTSSPFMSGRPRSRITRSGFSCAATSSAPLPSAASTTRKPCAARLVRRNRRIGGSSSAIRTQGALAMRARRCDGFGLGGRQSDGKDRAAVFAAIGSDDGAAHRLDETAADSKTETGAGPLTVLGVNTIEFVEDALLLALRNARPFVLDAQGDEIAIAPANDPDRRAGRRELGRIVE